MTEKEQPAPQESNQIVEERRAKLRELRTHGNAFPNDYRRSHLAADLHAGYDAKGNEELEPLNIKVSIGGRMMLKRVMGKASFATLQDMSGRIQLYVSNDVTGEAVHGAFKHWDLGDIVGAEGTLSRPRPANSRSKCNHSACFPNPCVRCRKNSTALPTRNRPTGSATST